MKLNTNLVQVPVELLKEIVLYCNSEYTFDGKTRKKREGISRTCYAIVNSDIDADGVRVPKDDLMNLCSVIDYERSSCRSGDFEDSLVVIEEIVEDNSRW